MEFQPCTILESNKKICDQKPALIAYHISQPLFVCFKGSGVGILKLHNCKISIRNQHCLLASSTIQQCGNRSLWVIKHILVFFRDGNAPFWWLKNELVICWDGNFLLPTTLSGKPTRPGTCRTVYQVTRSLDFVPKPQKFQEKCFHPSKSPNQPQK